MRSLTILLLALGVLACRRTGDNQTTSETSAGPGGVAPGTAKAPYDLNTPPPDAIKTASGLIYKKLVSKDSGAQPKRNDIVLLNLTTWRPGGETLFSNAGRNDPRPMNLAYAAPGFVEALQLLRKGEKAVLWMPASIGYKTPPANGMPEALVHEIEVAGIQPAPPIPDDVARPPDNAQATKLGIKYVVVRPGTGTDKARWFDTVTYNITAWDPTGRMTETTEQPADPRVHPVTGPAYKGSAGIIDVLTTMVAGQRTRFWADGEKMARSGKRASPTASGGQCYEIELVELARAKAEPPPTPPDVAKPPPDAKRSPKGVYYRVLKESNKNERPSKGAAVMVHYTGWTTDGKMFDTSVINGEPMRMGLNSVIEGWQEAIPLLNIGERARFWIPEELAYKGAEGKPQGMLVFDIELVEIVPPTNH